MKRLLFVICALAGMSAVAACSSSNSDNPLVVSSPSAPQGFTGATFSPAKLLPEVTLTDTAGKPWNFVKQSQGKVTVVYFGYTNCPDACPTDMHALGVAVGKLTPDQQKKVQVVFVTVDPRRDTRTVIRKWLDRFDAYVPAFVGLTGTAKQITAAAHQLGYQFDVTTTGKGLVSVEHLSQMTAFDETGTSNLAWIDPPSPTGIAHDLGLLISGVTPA